MELPAGRQMDTEKTFTNFLPREWADTLAYAKKINARLPHFESYLEAREVDAYSKKNARVVFEYMRDVAGKPLPAIEKHVMCNPQVAEEYLRYKKDSDPKNDDGGGMIMTLFRRLRSPQIKADATATKPKVENEQPVQVDMSAQSRAQADETFLRYVNDLIAQGQRKSFQASFISLRNGARHVGQFSVHGDELAMVTDTEWFIFDATAPSQVISVGHWPKEAKFEDVRNGLAIKEAAEQLSEMGPGAKIPATFVEKTSQAKGDGTLTLVQGRLLLSFGKDDKQFRYEIEYPFKRDQMPSPAEQEAFIEKTRRFSEAHEARKTNILDMIQKKPEGIHDQNGYHYQLSEDGQTITRTLWRGRVETFSREEFNTMEMARLAPKHEQVMSMGRGMSM
ncbi:hypothetical protein [Rhizobium sp. MHM7A]|uniref:hypothetical protein n=1 Tax=Rhizobium sp. MHM7A TaxID=2583233 RepID=UPI001105E19E|nr:hypothetical protein [Rhizobium sp. MHM7A]TLX17175.1 hypothetical protein FFR93_07650 [Rhizobium sp. MHM7A]